eukprot:Gb_17739 [translate_table: standard]
MLSLSSQFTRNPCDALSWPFSSGGSVQRENNLGSSAASSRSLKVLRIKVFRKFITCTAYIRAVKGSAICVMLGAKTMAMFREFILLYCSSCTTSAIRLIAQSKRAACVEGRSLTSSRQSSSVLHCITCSGVSESNTPLGSSLNHAFIKPAKQ